MDGSVRCFVATAGKARISSAGVIVDRVAVESKRALAFAQIVSATPPYARRVDVGREKGAGTTTY